MMNYKGSSLIFAIFLLIVFGFIGVTLVTIYTNESVTSSEELIMTKALYMAESGCEIAITDELTTKTIGYSGNSATLKINNFNVNIQKTVYDNVTVFECEAIYYTNDIKRKIRVKIRNN